jgi:hypothetical protein
MFWCFSLVFVFTGSVYEFPMYWEMPMNFLCVYEFHMFRQIHYVSVNVLCFSVFFSNVFISWYPSDGQVMNIIMFGDVMVLKRWKCFIFYSHDNWELVFSKPKRTLIYWAHVPKCIWWAFMMAFLVDLIGGEQLWEWND